MPISALVSWRLQSSAGEFYKYLFLLIFLLISLLIPITASAQAARVVDVRGTSMVERAGVAPRILGVGEKLDARDSISVARDSWTILEFSDQTRITLRPNTVFRLDSYKADAPEAMLLGLVKGGMRVVTGFFGKRNPAGVRVQTAVATIGIRGTEFDARLCEADCAQEERLHPAPLRALVAARVVEMKGVAAVTRSGEAGRLLVPGAALYEGDGIATPPDSYAVLVFRDGSRITLGERSMLMISAYRFDENKNTGHALMFHAEGRALVQTGSIAKQGPVFYRFISPMGEIRPRGTGFWSNVQSAAQSAGDTGQAAKDEADRRAAEEAAKLADEAARRAAAAQAEADRQAAAAAAEAARLAAEAERLAAEAAAAVKPKIVQESTIVLQAPKPGAGIGPTPASAIDLAALAASDAASAAEAKAEEARAAAAAAATEAERLAAAAAAEAARLAALVAEQVRRQEEAALLEKRRLELAALAAQQQAEQEAAAAKLKAEQDAAAAAALARQQITQLVAPVAPPKGPLVTADGLANAAAEVRRQAEALGADAAVAALRAATDPILNQMTALMTQMRNNPPDTEAAAQQMFNQFQAISSQLNAVISQTIDSFSGIAQSDAAWDALVMLMIQNIAVYSVYQDSAHSMWGAGAANFTIATVQIYTTFDLIKNSPDLLRSLDRIGINRDELSAIESSYGVVRAARIEYEIGAHLASHVSTAGQALFNELHAAIVTEQQRLAQQAAVAAAEAERLAAEAKQKADEQLAREKRDGIRIGGMRAKIQNPELGDPLNYDFTQHAWIPAPPPPAGPGRIPAPYPNLPPNPFRTSSPEKTSGSATESSVAVWDGEVDVIARGAVKPGEMLVGDGSLRSLDLSRLLLGDAPRPDQVKVDPGVFGGEPKPIDTGLYVWVRDGAVSLTKDDKSVDVPKGNAAVATSDDVKLLDAVPNFMRFDPTPLPNLSLTAKLDAFRLPDGALQNMCVIR